MNHQGTTIEDLPRFMPFIRRIARQLHRGVSIEVEDFAQEICLRAWRYPAAEGHVDDDAFRGWLFAVGKTVRYYRRRHDRQAKRLARVWSLDELLEQLEDDNLADYDREKRLLAESAGLTALPRQTDFVHLSQLWSRGRIKLRPRSNRQPTAQTAEIDDRRWGLLWRVAAGYSPGADNGRDHDDLYVARKALKEDFAL